MNPFSALKVLGRYGPQIIRYVGASLVMYLGGDAVEKGLNALHPVVSEITRPVGAIFGYDPQDSVNNARSFVITAGLAFSLIAWAIGRIEKAVK